MREIKNFQIAKQIAGKVDVDLDLIPTRDVPTDQQPNLQRAERKPYKSSKKPKIQSKYTSVKSVVKKNMTSPSSFPLRPASKKQPKPQNPKPLTSQEVKALVESKIQDVVHSRTAEISSHFNFEESQR